MKIETKKKTPFHVVYQILQALFDALVPARPTERVVEGVQEETLLALVRHDGTLPYHEDVVRALVW